MAKISNKPAPGISEKKRKMMLKKVGFDLRKNKKTGEFCTTKKRRVNQVKKSNN